MLFHFRLLEEEEYNFAGVKTVARHHNIMHTKIHDDSPNTVVTYAVHTVKRTRELRGSM